MYVVKVRGVDISVPANCAFKNYKVKNFRGIVLLNNKKMKK